MSTQRGKPQGNQPDAQRSLAGLLGGLLGGQAPQGMGFGTEGQNLPPGSSQDNEVANLLGGLLGSGSQAGGMPSGGQSGQGQGAPGLPEGSVPAMGGGDLGSLLGSLLGGGMGAQTPQQGSSAYGQSSQDAMGGDIGALLGGLLGGAAGASSSQQQGAVGGMSGGAGDLGGLGGLLGGLLGGGGGSGGLLGSLIGSDQASTAVSQQTGLAPSLVQALLPMIIGLLFRGNQRAGMRSQSVDIDGDGIPDNGDQVMNVVQRIQEGERVDPEELRSTGVTGALARHSGYSEDEVAPATLKILEALSQHAGQR